MKVIPTKDAVGMVLCHDITQIIRGVTKDAAFRKGHIVTEEDIPVLLSLGKDRLYVWENDENTLHENEAAEILCALCRGENVGRGEVKEGKISLHAECGGLLKVNRPGMRAVNRFGEMMIASRHGNFAVKKGDPLAGTRIIPLVIAKEKMEKARAACLEASGGEKILNVKPFRHKKVGILTTGNEVFYGRIRDTFTPVILEKFAEYDAEIIAHEICGDDDRMETAAILRMAAAGADIIVCTGGMSVDPDDRTPLAIRNTGAEIISYGAPVLPGAMFLLSYLRQAPQPARTDAVPEPSAGTGAGHEPSVGTDAGHEPSAGTDAGHEPSVGTEADHEPSACRQEERTITIMGLPGCVMYAKRTIFDLILPRVMADDPVTAEELADLGEGGLCLNCPVCTFPNCAFGK